MPQRIATHDSARARFYRSMAPSNSWCGRCGIPWRFVDHHPTKYNDQRSCFALCEGCWTLLGSPEARIEYYKWLIDWWEELGSPASMEEQMQIKRAVANGG